MNASVTEQPIRRATLIFVPLFVGAATGAAETAYLLGRPADPSVGRRAAGFLVRAMVYDVGLACLAFALAWLSWRLFLRRWPVCRRLASSCCGLRRKYLVLSLIGFMLVSLALAGRSIRGLPRASAPLTTGTQSASAESAPNLILILIDTLRADVLGAYGGEARTPNLDRLATEGALFERVLAPTSWTLPSVASIFTSNYPRSHGYVDFDRYMPEDAEALPGVLKSHGYSTQAIVGNPLMRPEKGFGRGFDLYDIYAYHLEGKLAASRALGWFLRRLKAWPYLSRQPVLNFEPSDLPYLTLGMTAYVQDQTLNHRVERFVDLSQSPLFLYVHYSAPHTPYLEHPLGVLNTAPPLRPENLEDLRELYRGEVEYVDGVIGELLDQLERSGVLDEAYVVVTSDHGEEFLEHRRWEHGYGLFEEVLRVPLLIRGPGVVPGTRVSEAVRLMDVAPTLLDLAGIAPSESYVGLSLAPAARGESAGELVSFAELTSKFLNPEDHYFSATEGRYKIVRRRTPEGELRSEEAYDLVLDPGELSPLGNMTAELEALAAKLDGFEALSTRSEGEEPTSEEMQRMQALGYVGNEGK